MKIKIIITSLFISLVFSIIPQFIFLKSAFVANAIQNIVPFTSNLRYGMKNSANVTNLQKFLKNQGYFSGPINGNFGPLTLSAVKKFQSTNRIIATGLWGLLSRTAANSIVSKQNIQNNTSIIQTPPTLPATSTAAIVFPAPITSATTTTPLSITTTNLPAAVAGTAYSTVLSASGGNGSYSWWVSDGTLPPGLNLLPSRCVGLSCPLDVTIYGTPVNSWTYNFTISVASGTQIVSQQFTISINPSVANLKLSQTNTINLNNGQTFEIKAFYTPAPQCDSMMPCYVPDATQVKVDWTSNNSNIASIAYKAYDPTVAIITGVSAGSATITANYTTGNINLSVVVPVFVAGTINDYLQITPISPTVTVGNTILLQALYNPQSICSAGSCAFSGSSAIIQAVWTSSNPGVATIAYKSDDPKTAVVTGISPGVTTITANVGYTSITGKSLTASTGLTVLQAVQQ